MGRSLLNNSDQWKFQKSSGDVLKQGWDLTALARLRAVVMKCSWVPLSAGTWREDQEMDLSESRAAAPKGVPMPFGSPGTQCVPSSWAGKPILRSHGLELAFLVP